MSEGDPVEWVKSTVKSADATTISYLSAGTGPGLVVIPGNNRRAHHYESLTSILGAQHRVHAIDRRGRGSTGPQGPAYSIDREVEDARAVLQATGASDVFGHSYGGLVALHLALRDPLHRLVVYEPGVSIGGSFDVSWLPEFRNLVARGRHRQAMTLFLDRSRLTPLGNAPRFVFAGLAVLLLHGSDGAETRAMMSTTPDELEEVARLDSDGSRYAAIASRTLILSGTRSPGYLTEVMPRLAEIMPNAEHQSLDGLDHNAPDLNAPGRIASVIDEFLDHQPAPDGPP
jgi:pimeloyl-ACP methyl ester carboxylesterase